MNAMADLRGFLDQAHDTHPHEPRAIADQLLARATALPADETGAEAVRLAEHVMLGHLADADALQRFLQALPRPSAAADPAPPAAWFEARDRGRWALDTLADEAATAAQAGDHGAPDLPDAPRWRALQNVVLALAGTGRVTEASARLSREAEAATAHADPEARRAYAICTNNVALELREGPRGDPARDALMLEAAALARRAWTAAGTWLQVERADYQLARCHAVIGRGTEALAFARACLEACTTNGAEADERFFAHEALWHAHRAAGDESSAAAERQRMRALLKEIADAEMHAWCAATLAGIEDAPGSLR
jgi:hypothetical protein